MRALLERDFERFRGGLPQRLRRARSRGVSHRPDRPLPRLHPAASRSARAPASSRSIRNNWRPTAPRASRSSCSRRSSPRTRSGRAPWSAWAIHETRMKVERVRSGSGLEGWTVTWKGRGWDRSFDDYLALVRTAGDLTRSGAMVAVPSAKYHLPQLDEAFREDEYRHTTERLADAWGGDVAGAGEGLLADPRRRRARGRARADPSLAAGGARADPSGRRRRRRCGSPSS